MFGLEKTKKRFNKLAAYHLLMLYLIFGWVSPALFAAEASSAHEIITNGFKYSIEPKPSWVVPVVAERNEKLPSAPMHYELIESQTKVDASTASTFSHVIRVVNQAAGLATATQIQFVFDPSYQSLVLHQFDVIRNGQRINKLVQKNIQLLQRETQLEYLMYNGLVTATIVLDDVRAKDKLEYAYTIKGVNPVFQNKFVHEDVAFAELGPVSFYQYRLLIPADRLIQYKAGADIKISNRSVGGMNEVLFRRSNIPQFKFDPTSTADSYVNQMLMVSEFANWEQVANWGNALFSNANTQSSEVKAKALEIKKNAQSKRDQLQVVLNFVQEDVRYLGVELGANSHQPVPPEKVLQQKFGDCKDKTLLLISLLRELDIEAKPVLVSTRYFSALDKFIPTPFAFNHAIAKVNLEGQSYYWFDGTRTHQQGTLTERQSMGLGKALVVDKNVTVLESLPSAVNQERVSVEEAFSMTKFSEGSNLQSKIIYYGELAELLRARFASQAIEETEEQFSADYVKLYPSLRKNKSINIKNVEGRNAIVVTQDFVIPDFWQYKEEKALEAEIVFWNAVISHPNDMSRKEPLLIQYPGIYRHTSVVNFYEDVFTNNQSPQSPQERNPIFDFTLNYQITAKSAKSEAVLKLNKNEVLPSEWRTFVDNTLKIKPSLATTVSVSPISLTESTRFREDLIVLDKAIKQGKVGYQFATGTQVRSKIKVMALSYQLAGTRLNQKQRAMALKSRGEHLDNLGQYKTAHDDFSEAIRIAPSDAGIYSAAAINALMLEKDALAKEYANKALALSSSELSPYSVLAHASYYAKDYNAAKTYLNQYMAKTGESEQGYMNLWLYLTLLRAGEDTKILAQKLQNSASQEWATTMLAALLDTNKVPDAMKKAQSDEESAAKLCELNFYLGEKFLIQNNHNLAKKHLKQSVETGATEYMEFALAKRTLKQLGSN